MHRRKIQLIAGSTYSLSLPKEWVLKNKLKEKSELLIQEKNDRTLIISPQSQEKSQLTEISINIEENLQNIDQVLFSVYYLGIENISIKSKANFSKEAKSKIRTTLENMSGTEITYEDEKNIRIKVFLDKEKVDISQILYRTYLLIESSISNLLGDMDKYELRLNEAEIDRLYHLMAKITHLSLINANVLVSSKIKNISLIPSYFLISKRLENIGDNIFNLSKHLRKENSKISERKEILSTIGEELGRCIKSLNNSSSFSKIQEKNLKEIKSKIEKISDELTKNYLKEIFRYLIDIQEEIVNISFFNSLIKQNLL